MLSPRLTNCPECSNPLELIAEIDCKLTELAKNMYNNISYMLNQPVPSETISDLIHYKRILMYKYFNPDYAADYTVNTIASRIKILKFR